MNRDPEIKARLERWGCWAASGRVTLHSTGVSSVYRLAGAPRSCGDMSLWSGFVPYQDNEALATEALIRQLDEKARRVAIVVYVRAPTGTLETWGRRLGLGRSAVFAALCRLDQQFLICLSHQGVANFTDKYDPS